MAQTSGRARKLHWFSRALSSVIGAAALVFGTLGVFFVERDWGPIALLVIGTLLMLVGLSGRIPSVKWQDNEVTWPQEEAAAALREVVESGSPEEQREALNELDEIAPIVAGPALRAMEFASRVMAGIREALPSGVGLQPGVMVGNWMTDAILSDQAGRKVLVEIRSSRQLPTNLVSAVDQAKKLDNRVIGGLLLVREEPPRSVRGKLEAAGWSIFDASELHVDPADVARLQTLIASIFQEADRDRAQ